MKKLLYNTAKASKKLNVATTAMVCDEEPDKNISRLCNFVEEIITKHPQTDLIVFGETINGWFFNFDKTAEYHHQIAEEIPGKTTQNMVELAIKHKIHICFGLNEKSGDNFFNSQVLIDTKGEVIAVHRKTKMREKYFTPGERLVTIADIKGIRTGIVICYDVQGKEVNKALRRSKLDLIIHSLADDEDPREFGTGYLSRSYDAWLINANRFGEEGGHYWNGWITITDPVGRVHARGKEKEQYLYHEIKIVQQNAVLKLLGRFYVRGARIMHIVRNLDMALATVFDRKKVKKQKKK